MDGPDSTFFRKKSDEHNRTLLQKFRNSILESLAPNRNRSIDIIKRTHFIDPETFLCFEFVSDEFCGKIDIPNRSKYTQQVFDFFDKHFPGVNIGEGTR